MESRSFFSHCFKVMAAAFFGLAPLLLASQQAIAVEIRCDHCSEATFQTMARQAGVGIHYVYDLKAAQSRKYAVERSCEGPHDCHMEATSLPVESEVTNLVLELTAYGQTTQWTMKSYFTITADGTAQNLSAFDVAGPGGPRTQLFDWFNSTQLASIRNALPMLGAATHNIAVTIASIWNENMGKTLVRILFTDGSEVTLEYESINRIITVVEDSAKDRYGNVIPVTANDIDGTRFDYSREGPNGPAQQRMSNYLRVYGVNVSSGSTRWMCVRVSDGAWHCALY
jgi:hypothetical protein